jgi:ComEC/Rec2-related protein
MRARRNGGCSARGMDHPFRNLGPVLLLSLPLLSGFFLGLLAGPCHAAVAAGFLLLSLLLIVFRWSPVSVAFAVMALCGALAAGRFPLIDPDLVRPFLGEEVALRGNVFQIRHTDTGWTCIVEGAEVSSLDRSDSIRPGRVLLSVRNPVASVSFPAELRATGRLYAIKSRGNPGEIPREWTALALRVQYRFFSDASRSVFLPIPEGCAGGTAVFQSARARVERWLASHAGDSEGALYLRAVATGNVPPPSHPMVTLLRRTGLGHLLAISGLHVVIFYSVQSYLIRFVLWVLRRRHGAPDLNRMSALLSLPGCWAYALMAGSPVSAIRAAGMLSVVVFLRHLLGVRGSGAAWTVLFLSTLVCAPSWVVSPSFLLSYGASFFLIAAFGGKGRTASRTLSFLRVAAGWARNAVVGSTIAFLGTLPVSAAFFGQLPAGAILWNILFVPLLGIVGVAGAFLGVVGGVFSVELFGFPVRIAAEFLSDSLLALARASGNGSCWYPLPPTGIAAPIVCTGAAAAGSLWLRTRGREAWPSVAIASVVFLAWIHAPYAALPDHRLTLVALNVGKGAAHVLSFPGGGHMIVDCGSGLRGDKGETVVLPYLRSRGIRRIDVLVLTHPHEDHYGGAAAVLSSLPVGEIWIPEGIPPGAFGGAVRKLTDRVRWKSRGDRYRSGGAEVIVRGTGMPAERQKTNEQSLVLEIRHGNFSAWLPGDVEQGPSAWGEDSRVGKGAKTVLFLPHHGSAMAKPEAWIRTVSPDAVVSQNSNCLIKKNLVPSGLSFFLENGAVIMRSDGNMHFIEQDRRPNFWELLLRLPSER